MRGQAGLPNIFQRVARSVRPTERERHLEKQLRETQSALIGTQTAYQSQLEETQRALLHTQNVLRETQSALTETQTIYQSQLEETQQALLHTQDVLRNLQISVGMLDNYTKEPIQRDTSIESIMLVSPPKAAGSYIMNTLMRGLKLEQRWVALGYFGSPDLFKIDQLNRFWLDCGCISFIHTRINPFNLFLLKQTDLKIILNIRDPRQCVHSLVHYNLRHFPRAVGILHPAQPPDDFPEWSFEKQVDWQIDHQLQNYVGWIQDWLRVVDSGEVDGLITGYDRLLADEATFFNSILDFYGIARNKFRHPQLALTHDVNFRAGDPNEWKNAFSREQIKKCREMIPDTLMERFGWDEVD